jgi:hypothetical protein
VPVRVPSRQIVVRAASVVIRAGLRETPTAGAIWAALPVYAVARTWGDEVYFDVPVACMREADATDVVAAGQFAYWPDGKVVAIGFGPTPLSVAGEIRLAGACNLWADALDDVRRLSAVRDGERIAVLAADS